MIKALLVLLGLTLFKGYNSNIEISIDSTRANQYPYKLFQSNSNYTLNSLTKLDNDNGNCFFLFHFISYSIIYFKKFPDEKGSKIECAYNEDEKQKQVTLTFTNGIKTDSIILKNDTIYSEVQKQFWIQNDTNASVNLFFQIDNINQTLNQIHLLKNISETEAIIIQSVNISTSILYFEHFMFKNLFIKWASFFGYSCILIGLFIATFGSLFHRTTAGLYTIFFLIGFTVEIFEPLLPSGLYTESFGILILCVPALVGIFVGWLIILNKSVEKTFYGAMLGFVLFKIISYCYLLININGYNGFKGEIYLIDFFWVVVAALFGFFYLSLYNNQLSFIISTCIVGSYMVVYGYNLFLGGYLEDSLVFSIRKISRELNENKIYSEFRDIWNNGFVLMYFIVWICLSFGFFLIQTILRYRREMEKPMNEQRGLFKSVHVKKEVKEDSKPVTDSNQTETVNKTEEENQEEEEDNDDENTEEDNKNISTYSD